MTLRKFLKLWGAQGARNLGRGSRLKFFFFTTAEGAAPPEGEINPTKGGCFASLYYNTVLDGFVTLYVRSL